MGQGGDGLERFLDERFDKVNRANDFLETDGFVEGFAGLVVEFAVAGECCITFRQRVRGQGVDESCSNSTAWLLGARHKALRHNPTTIQLPKKPVRWPSSSWSS